MNPDEMLGYIKRIPGLDHFPIKDHEHLIRLLGGKDKVVTFKDQRIGTEDILRMFPVNYFPIASKEDLIDKASKLIELGRRGFHPATGSPPQGGPPKSIKTYETGPIQQGADGYQKADRHPK
jgi:hypothetical protein